MYKNLSSPSIADYGKNNHNYTCPNCDSKNIILGAGRRPSEESRRCGDCRFFLGFSPITLLIKARKRKEPTECLQVLENQAIQGKLALFVLNEVGQVGGTK